MEISASTIGVASGLVIIGTSYLMAVIANALLESTKKAKIVAYIMSFLVFVFMHPVVFEFTKAININVVNSGHAGYNFFMPYWVVGIISIFLGNYFYKRRNTSNKSLKPGTPQSGAH